MFVGVFGLIFCLKLVSGKIIEAKNERIEIVMVDKTYMMVLAETIPYNESFIAPNITFILFYPFDDQTQATVSFFKKVENVYIATNIYYTRPLKDMLNTVWFGIDKMSLQYFKPPLTWPLKTHIFYRMLGFSPDFNKYKFLIPAGQYKLRGDFISGNGQQLLTMDWFMTLTYNN